MVIIRQNRHAQAVVAVIGDFENSVLGQFALNRHPPVLNVRSARVRRDVVDIVGDRIEIARRGEACGSCRFRL